MSIYIIKRLFLIIPTLVLISLLAFFLSRMVPQDPVIAELNKRGQGEGGVDISEYEKIYNSLELNKPEFYFSIVPKHYPATLNGYSDYTQKQTMQRLLDVGLHHTEAHKLINDVNYQSNFKLPDSELKELLKSTHKLTQVTIPSVHWHGTNNQYHSWLTKALKGNFGNSILDGRSALATVGKALLWTIHIAIPAILFTFVIGLLIGYFLARKKGSQKERLLNQLLYVVYSIPVFWLATMAIMYLTTDDYGSWTNIFPSAGIDIFHDRSTLAQIWLNSSRLILPIVIGSLGSIAYIARIMRRSILDEMKAPYILTAYSKGLDHEAVIKKHALPNSLLPFITILAGAIPSTLGGSVVLEVIFNIPGIGRLLYNSIGQADWNVVFCIIIITGIVNIISYLLADLLYARVNPKIRY